MGWHRGAGGSPEAGCTRIALRGELPQHESCVGEEQRVQLQHQMHALVRRWYSQRLLCACHSHMGT